LRKTRECTAQKKSWLRLREAPCYMQYWRWW